MDTADPQTYSITGAGPLRMVQRALRITRDGQHDIVRKVGATVALAYLPFVAVLIASGRVMTGCPSLDELTTHVRALVALPILVVAEGVIEKRAQEAGHYLHASGLVTAERANAHRAAIASTGRLRDSSVIEIVLLLGTLVSVIAWPGFTRESAPALRWSIVPALFLYRFFLLRFLWRWGLWALYLGPTECASKESR